MTHYLQTWRGSCACPHAGTAPVALSWGNLRMPLPNRYRSWMAETTIGAEAHVARQDGAGLDGNPGRVP